MKLSERIQKVINSLDKTIELSKLTAVQIINANVKERIFNKGEGKMGEQIGVYDNMRRQTFLTGKAKLTKKQRIKAEGVEDIGMTYKELRKLRGLQTDFVDLKFSGSLQNSIITNKDSIFFNNNKETKIAGYNEKHFGKKIFAPSANESQIFIDILDKNIHQLFI